MYIIICCFERISFVNNTFSVIWLILWIFFLLLSLPLLTMPTLKAIAFSVPEKKDPLRRSFFSYRPLAGAAPRSVLTQQQCCFALKMFAQKSCIYMLQHATTTKNWQRSFCGTVAKHRHLRSAEKTPSPGDRCLSKYSFTKLNSSDMDDRSPIPVGERWVNPLPD